MAELPNMPDLTEIAELLAAVSALDPAAGVGVTRFDQADQILRNAQGEVTDAMSMADLPEPYRRDDLESLLHKIQETIDTNRAKREQAKARETGTA